MNYWIGIVLGLAVLTLLFSCARKSPDLGACTWEDCQLYDVRLKDGTRCVVSGKGGVACDWVTGRTIQ